MYQPDRKFNRKLSRVRYVDYSDPVLGPMEISEPALLLECPAYTVIHDIHLGDLSCSPATRSKSDRSTGPPVLATAKRAGGR